MVALANRCGDMCRLRLFGGCHGRAWAMSVMARPYAGAHGVTDQVTAQSLGTVGVEKDRRRPVPINHLVKIERFAATETVTRVVVQSIE